MTPEQLHHVRCPVRPDSRKREQTFFDLGIGIALDLAQCFEIQLAGGNGGCDRPHVGPAIAHASDLAIPRIRGRREHERFRKSTVAELGQRAGHANRCRPRAVRRADRFDDVFKHARTRQNATGALRRPLQRAVTGNERVKRREIVAKPEHARDRGLDLRTFFRSQGRRRLHDELCLTLVHRHLHDTSA